MKRMKLIANSLIGLGAAVLWGSSRMAWLTIEAFDDKAGDKTVDMLGSVWSTEATALAFVLLAACVAGFALRKTGRRVIGIVAAIAAAGAAWTPMQLLAGTFDEQRVQSLLTSTATATKAQEGALLNSWAEITEISIQTPAVLLALLGCALALMGGIFLALRPGEDSGKKSQYERKQAREEKVLVDLQEEPDSGRVLWDALDADIDPTEIEAKDFEELDIDAGPLKPHHGDREAK